MMHKKQIDTVFIVGEKFRFNQPFASTAGKRSLQKRSLLPSLRMKLKIPLHLLKLMHNQKQIHLTGLLGQTKQAR